MQRQEIRRLYEEDFDLLNTKYQGDIAEWANDMFLDVEYTIDSKGNLKRLCLLKSLGGPNIWICLGGGDLVEVEIYEPFKEPETVKFYHEKAREIFDYFSDLLKETLICQ